MQATRRKFFGMVGTAPLAARGAAEAVTRQLAGIGAGLSYNTGVFTQPMAAQGQAGQLLGFQKLRQEAFKRAVALPQWRGEIESILYQQYRQIGNIDPDIAVMRSFSLSAKIAFQRQRVVARALKHDVMEEPTCWQQMSQWTERVLEWAGVKL
jgi:hypothetical protein